MRDPASQRPRRRLWSVVCFGGALVLSAASRAAGQSTLQLITESTVTYGRPSADPLARTLLLADLGLRWTVRPTWSIGFSLSGGYDAPGNVALAGARVRAAREWERSRIEASVGLYYQLRQFHQRSGAVVGVAYYPLPWVALVSQVDLLPTPHLAEWLPTRGGYGADTSVGLRLGEGAALVSWGLTALGGLFVAMIGSPGPMGL